MPAMHYDVLHHMRERIEMKRDLMLRLVPFDLTHDECIHLVAPHEHVPILIGAAQYADITTAQDWMAVTVPHIVDGEPDPRVMLKMCTHGDKEPPLRPRNPSWQHLLSTQKASDKVIQWVAKRLELGRRFGTVDYVLQQLNSICDNGTQLRYMFPPVLHLIRQGVNPRADRWAAKHAEYKPCRHTPAVSPQLKRAIQDASALLTSAVLMGSDVPALVPGEVEIDMWDMPTFIVDDRIWSRK